MIPQKGSTRIHMSQTEEDFNIDTTTKTSVPTILPSCIQSPVLKLAYPALVAHNEKYGNPNIPLGSTDGKRAKTLRRLAFQKKLSPEEMNLLDNLNFRLNSLEDVYEEANFDDCLQRLLDYKAEFKTNYQIPKKYNPDPELGAWVTIIRRIGRDDIESVRRKKLDNIGFAWVSTRKCGSAFMKSFRSLKERLESCAELNKDGLWEVVDQDGVDEVLKDEEAMKWVRAQRGAAKLRNLSESRCEYLDHLPGLDWKHV